MKKLLVLLLIIIIAFLGYDFYKDWKRFNPPNYFYKSEVNIDKNHPDKKLLLDYYQAVERLNGYVITQWTTNEIDVFGPKDDDEAVIEAVKTYNNKLGIVKYYESQLLAPKKEKKEQEPKKDVKKDVLYKMFNNNPRLYNTKRGSRGAFVFEVQKLLNSKGDSIAEDGLFNLETQNSLKAFEEKNGLFPDGLLDELTLHYLLQ